MGIPLSILSALLQTLIASSCKLDRERDGRKKEQGKNPMILMRINVLSNFGKSV